MACSRPRSDSITTPPYRNDTAAIQCHPAAGVVSLRRSTDLAAGDYAASTGLTLVFPLTNLSLELAAPHVWYEWVVLYFRDLGLYTCTSYRMTLPPRIEWVYESGLVPGSTIDRRPSFVHEPPDISTRIHGTCPYHRSGTANTSTTPPIVDGCPISEDKGSTHHHTSMLRRHAYLGNDDSVRP